MTERKTSPFPVDRRAFLKSSGLGLFGLASSSLLLPGCSDSSKTTAGALAGSTVTQPKLGAVLGFARVVDPKRNKVGHGMTLIDLDAEKPSALSFAMNFFGHGIALDPNDANRAVVFEKRGPGCCEMNLAEGRVVRMITTVPERKFYGHGSFSTDGRLLYCTEAFVKQNYKGVVAVRDAHTFKLLGQFPSHGVAPHDCRLVDGGRTMVVANGGGSVAGPGVPSVCYVDVQTEKLIERVPFLTPGVQAGHFDLTSRGDLAIVGGPRDGLGDIAKLHGAVNLRVKGAATRAMDTPTDVTSRMWGESLSVSIHEASSTVAVTNPVGNIVTFWNLSKGVFIKSLDLKIPRGVSQTLDRRQFVFSHSATGSLVRVDCATLQIVPGTKVEDTNMAGSHLVTWRRPRPA